jgi:hypothetical protein
MTIFCDTWIPDTMRIFAPTGAAIHTRGFWSSQMRNELDHRLWRPQHLGREATDEELDRLVDSAMEINWPRIERILDDRSSEKCTRSRLPDPDETVASLVELKSRQSPTRTKLRRALALEDIMAQIKIHNVDEEDEGEGHENSGVEHFGWETFDSSVLEQVERGGEHKKQEVRMSRVGKSVVKLQDLDDGLEMALTSDVVVAKAKARPALASSLLKKTLRDI